MAIILLILFGFLVYIYAVNVRALLDKESQKPLYQYRKPDPVATKPVVNNEAAVPKKRDFYGDADFVNKNCTRLEDFIINDEINGYDLRKLADLNGIDLHIKPGWYPLTIALIKELDNDGWDKTVLRIKEKYAELRFYANHEHRKILSKYEEKSREICETCGEWGSQRSNSDFIYVACRKHYLESRGRIYIEESGFNYNQISYPWHDIKSASFDKLFFKENGTLAIEYIQTLIQHRGWIEKKLRISKYTVGFGLLLNHLPKSIPNLDYDYIENFKEIEYCEICGYKSVYRGECECCENDDWETDQKKWNRDNELKSEKEIQEKKREYIVYNQLVWAKDEGDFYERKQKNYPKNPHHKPLYTENELEEYLFVYEDEDEDDDEE